MLALPILKVLFQKKYCLIISACVWNPDFCKPLYLLLIEISQCIHKPIILTKKYFHFSMSLSSSLGHFWSKRHGVAFFTLYIGEFHPISLRSPPCHCFRNKPFLQACPEALVRGLRAGEYLPQTYSQNLVFSSLVLMLPWRRQRNWGWLSQQLDLLVRVLTAIITELVIGNLRIR